MKTKAILLALFIICSTFGFAQQSVLVLGSVRDGFLDVPIFQAKVTLLTADSVVVQDSIPLTERRNSKGILTGSQYTLKVSSGKYIVRASLKGYNDAYREFEIKEEYMGMGGIYMVDPLDMFKARTVQLSEVEVVATKVKMFYRGDTLIYDATAFQLPDGSMLDELIKQLPGTTMNEQGEIFVNGRKVEELQLGSRSFFRGNSKVILRNLPYYTVKNIKVYEQDTDRNRALGAAIDRKTFVMDVNLKQEYNRGYLGNVELADGTEERFLGRGFLLSYADPFRFTLLGNANNVNESRNVGQTDSWTPDKMPRSLLTTYSIAGELDYQSADKNVKDNLNAEFLSTKNESEMLRRSELFLDGLTPYSTLHFSDLTKAKKLSVKNKFTLGKPFFLVSDIGFTHNSYSGNSLSLTEQFNDDELLTRMSESGLSDGRLLNAYFKTHAQFSPQKGGKKISAYNYIFSIEHDDETVERMKEYAFAKPFADKRYNSNDYSRKHTSISATAGYDYFPGTICLNTHVGYNYKTEQLHDYLYHPDTLLLPSQLEMLNAITDPNNSYDSHHRAHEIPVWIRFCKRGFYQDYHASMGDFQHDYFVWELNASFSGVYQELDYMRGALDTLATKTCLKGNVSFTYNLFPRKRYENHWEFNINHFVTPASIYDAVNYRDDAQPLVVKLGNPELKSKQATMFSVDYRRRSKEWMNQSHLGLDFIYHHRQIAQSVTYNLQSGVYTYKPVNVSGGYHIESKFDISRLLDKNKLWTWQMNANAKFTHSKDHSVLEGVTSSRENAVNTLALSDNAYIQYNKGKLSIRAVGDIVWRHSEGRMRDFSTLNVLDFSYGINGRYTLPFRLTFATDVKMYSRRGYGSSSMNTNDFVWNASLSQSLIKGKLVARIETFDLLYQVSSTQYEVNAQGRIETWHRSLPNYVMFHLQWMFNKNSSKN